ncbi:MAG TPA: M48 family metalloprotease [Acidobacteriota bacterium]|nr:M48 family metalloprotease [Acidobacteriota bacterium]
MECYNSGHTVEINEQEAFGGFMKRLLIFVYLVLFSINSASGQFGKLKGVLDKTQKSAEKVKGLKISEEDEIALGKAISDQVCAKFGVQQDLEATRYVTLVGSVMVEHSSRPTLPFRFIILDSSAINAFAAPGGFVHVTRGALASMKNEAELAGVLGHEIAHVTQRHTANSIEKGKWVELGEGQTTLRSNPAIFQKVVDKAAEGIFQGWGREQELDADGVGERLAFKVGYDPSGLAAFLQTLKSQNEGSSSRSGLFASHPETEERIQKLQAQISSEKLFNQAAVTLPDRFKQFIKYELKAPTEAEAAVEGAKGLAGSEGKKDKDKDKDKDEKEGEKKKSRFSLAKLKNPLGAGEEQKSAQVTGSGAGRAVGKETASAEDANKPKNPNRVETPVSKDDVKKFKEAGKLQ